MTFKNPLHRFRGAELKEPIYKARATLGKEVRKLLAAHPEGMTNAEINEKIPDAWKVMNFLRRAGFAKERPWNAKDNPRRCNVWVASEPKPIEP
jgi:hypothetical protein